MNTRIEEEQLETLKYWWHKYGTIVMVGLLVAIACFYGWQYWQSKKYQVSATASLQYQALLSGIESKTDDQIIAIANNLMTNYKATPYAAIASLVVSAQFIKKNNLTDAATYLQWVLDNGHDINLQMIARLRLIRVLLAKNDIAMATKTLNDVPENKAFAGAMHELQGDIFYYQKLYPNAYRSYKDALEILPKDSPGRRMLEIKMQDVAQ